MDIGHTSMNYIAIKNIFKNMIMVYKTVDDFLLVGQ